MFTEYGKAFVLNFSEIGNTVFFWPKKLMEIWYLLSIFEFSVIFQDLGDMVFGAVYSSKNYLEILKKLEKLKHFKS